MEEFHIGLQIPTEHMQNIFGNYDSYIRQIEDDLQVVITDRNGEVRIAGEEGNVNKAVKLLQDLIELSKRGNQIQDRMCLMHWNCRKREKKTPFLRLMQTASAIQLQASQSNQRPWGRRNILMQSGIK